MLNRGGIIYYTGNNVNVNELAEELGAVSEIDRTVVNRTGLMGNYDVTLQYTPPALANAAAASDPSAPPLLFTALKA